MTILFSPIGNTDPWRNDRDGAMLHIVRNYQPEEVWLFFTKSLWDTTHNKYEWENIIKNVSKKETKVKIIVENVENPHDFDAFKDLFHHYINSFHIAQPDKTMILNVTSGTPQMETTLCLEYITYPENKKVVQVSTPEKSSNVALKYASSENQEEQLYTVNNNEQANISRFKEIEIISFRESMIRNQVKELIDNFEYEGAIKLIQNQKGFRNRKIIIKCLEEVSDHIKSHKIFNDLKEKYTNKDIAKIIFHINLLNMSKRTGKYAEALIRVKSIAEYISEKYIMKYYPGLLYRKNDRVFVDYKYDMEFQLKFLQHFKDTEQYRLNDSGEEYFNLSMAKDIFEIQIPNETITENIWSVLRVNKLRNSVAHNLDELDLKKNKGESAINEAIINVQQAALELSQDINKDDFNYIDKINGDLKKIL